MNEDNRFAPNQCTAWGSWNWKKKHTHTQGDRKRKLFKEATSMKKTGQHQDRQGERTEKGRKVHKRWEGKRVMFKSHAVWKTRQGKVSSRVGYVVAKGWWGLRGNNRTDEQKKGKEGKTAETTDEPREQAARQTRRYSITNDGRGNVSWVAWLNISLGLVCAFVCCCVCVCVGMCVRVPGRQKGGQRGSERANEGSVPVDWAS